MALTIALLVVASVPAWTKDQSAPEKPFTAQSPREEELQRALERIVIPRLALRDATYREAIDILGQQAKRFDPKKRGVPFLIHIDPSIPLPPAQSDFGRPESIPESPKLVSPNPEDVRITVLLTNIPLINALSYITGVSYLKFRVRPDGVHIVASLEPELLITRDLRVSPAFRATDPGVADALRKDPRAYLLSLGVVFDSPAATAILDDHGTRLTIHNAADQIELVAQILHPPSATEARRREREMQRRDALCRRMEAIILPEVHLHRVSLMTAVDTLEKLSRQHDHHSSAAGNRGMHFILEPADSESSGGSAPSARQHRLATTRAAPTFDERHRLIDYSETQVTLLQAITAIADQSGRHLEIRPPFVYLRKYSRYFRFITREWQLPPDAFARDNPAGPPSAKELSPDIPSDLSREYANTWIAPSALTIVAPPSAIYIPRGQRLILRDDEEALWRADEKVESLWREYLATKHPGTDRSSSPSE